MEKYTQRLLKALQKGLPQTPKTTMSVPDCRSAILLCKKALTKLKAYALQYPAADQSEEIFFFKVIKPAFYSKFIYYIRVYDFMMKYPPGGQDAQQNYVHAHLQELQLFFDHNRAFYQYYRSGLTHLDELYFTRGPFKVQAEMEDFEADDEYATSHDYKLARLIANEFFQEFLNRQISGIGQGGPEPFPFNHPVWTGTQTDAVELAYSLKAAGAVNNGNIDISELIGIFEFIFQMEIKESYHKYIDITRRKKDLPVFVNKLRDGLIRLVEEKFA